MGNFFCRLWSRDNRTAIETATDAYNGINSLTLSCMSKGELARWQANHRNDPAKSILAEQEWQNRRLAKQIHTSYVIAFFGICGTLGGTVLGWALRSSSIEEHVVQFHGRGKDNKQELKPTIATPKPSNTTINSASSSKP